MANSGINTNISHQHADTAIVMADETTKNTSNTAHGFMPKVGVAGTIPISTGTAISNVATNYGRNKITNGNFPFWQRGTSLSAGTGGYLADMWQNYAGGATIAVSQQAFTVGQYLDQEAAARIAEGGTGGPSVRKEVRISDQTTAKALIDAIFQDTLGRKASGKEILKYTKNLQAAQKAAPTITTYATSGGTTTSTTTGGINEQQYLIDQIAGTDEAKTNQVLGYYKTFMDALGGK